MDNNKKKIIVIVSFAVIYSVLLILAYKNGYITGSPTKQVESNYQSKIYLDVGDTYSIDKDLIQDKNNKIKNSNNKVATINKDGKVVAKAKGKTTITIKNIDNKVIKEVEVVVDINTKNNTSNNNPNVVINDTIPENNDINIVDDNTNLDNNNNVVVDDTTNKDDNNKPTKTEEKTKDKESNNDKQNKPTQTPTTTTPTQEQPKEIKSTSIEITNKVSTIYKGDKAQLYVKILPANTTNKTVTWSSSNTNILNVKSNGEVTGVNTGTANITVKNGDKSTSITINVINKPATVVDVDSIVLNKTTVTLDIGKSETITATVKPDNATNKTILWSSNSNAIADVDSKGKITARGVGNATIIAKSSNGKTATVNVTVKEIKPTSIKLDRNAETVYINGKTKEINLKATITPDNATNKEVIWNSSNPKVATVNGNGKVTIVNAGTTTITASTKDRSLSAKYELTVNKKVIIVIGESQVSKMNDYVKSYSSANYNYQTSDGTLNYFFLNGSGAEYQVQAGFNEAKAKIITDSNNPKENTEYFIFFPIAGNDVKNFTCTKNTNTWWNYYYNNNEWYISSTNEKIKTIASSYNNIIKDLNSKDEDYNAKGFVVGVEPVNSEQRTDDYVVVSSDSNTCAIDYRSNNKYNKFNSAMSSIINSSYTNNLTWITLFNDIVEVKTSGRTITESWKYKDYNTIDGIHWDEATTKYYVNKMFDKVKEKEKGF